MAASFNLHHHHHHHVVLFLSIFLVVSNGASYAFSETETLVKFKSSLTNATALENWDNNPKPPCTERHANWVGIICYKGTIWGLQLENMGLSGIIDVNILTKLPNLRTLSFRNNNFKGPLPKLDKLSTLKSIYLSNNGFSGGIPENAFEGMNWLKKLYLSRNQFTGPIPTSLASLHKLLVLKLDNNQFSGPIPSFEKNSLQKVDFSNNQLEGSIPASLSKMDTTMFSGNRDLCGGPLKACPPNSKSTNKIWGVALLALVVLVVILAIFTVIIIKQRKQQKLPLSVEGGPPTSNLRKKEGEVKQQQDQHSPSPGSGGSVNGKKSGEASAKLTFLRDDRDKFDLSDLLKASAEILGSGSFGSSYKAALPLSIGSTMVVKRYKKMNNSGKEEFQEHMRRLSRLSHDNLLPLVAYYYRKEEKLLVTDFVTNGSLAVHLHGHQSLGQPSLDWPTRLKIVKGVANGLAHLYKELPSMVAPHGHLKSSNVLLNQSFEPFLTDYGLIPVINQESAQELMVAYKSPEYVQHGRITKKTDVWGLGVLILEILTGKFPSNFLQKGKGSNEEDLATWVKSVIGDHDLQNYLATNREVFDKEMGVSINTNNNDADNKSMVELLKVGLNCCEVDVEKRLDLKDAIGRIEALN